MSTGKIPNKILKCGGCGSVVRPMEWIEYKARLKGLDVKDIDVGDVLVITLINRVFEELLKYFKPKP